MARSGVLTLVKSFRTMSRDHMEFMSRDLMGFMHGPGRGRASMPRLARGRANMPRYGVVTSCMPIYGIA